MSSINVSCLPLWCIWQDVEFDLSRDMTKQTKWVCAKRRLRSSSLIRVFAVRMKKAWVLSYPFSAQRRLWSDWADAQAESSLGAQSLCWFCHVTAHIYYVLYVRMWSLSCSFSFWNPESTSSTVVPSGMFVVTFFIFTKNIFLSCMSCIQINYLPH